MNTQLATPSSKVRHHVATIDTTIGSSPSTEGVAPAGVLRSNARLCPPDDVMRILCDVVATPGVAVLVDVDAIERRALVKAGRATLLALDALSHAGVQIVLLSQDDGERTALLHRGISRSWWFDRRCGWRDREPPARRGLPIEAPLALVRERTLDAPLLVISDDPAWFDALADRDRGISLAGRGPVRSHPNIAVSGAASVRAALWWLVDARTRAAAAAQP